MAASATLKLVTEDFERLAQAVEQFDGQAGPVIDGVLKEFGAKEIETRIRPLIHASGRDWSGKIPSATSVNPFQRTFSPLTVEIKSKSAYGYLYFPDDGGTSRRHAGKQHFMQRGVEAATEPIIDMCISRLIQKIGE